MTSAVESVVGGRIHEECVQQRPSAKGSYISVTLGPILVQNTDQVRHSTMPGMLLTCRRLQIAEHRLGL